MFKVLHFLHSIDYNISYDWISAKSLVAHFSFSIAFEYSWKHSTLHPELSMVTTWLMFALVASAATLSSAQPPTSAPRWGWAGPGASTGIIAGGVVPLPCNCLARWVRIYVTILSASLSLSIIMPVRDCCLHRRHHLLMLLVLEHQLWSFSANIWVWKMIRRTIVR